MKKRHMTYEVYRNGVHMGDTWAVSALQAINNVRHKTFGDYTTQYDGAEWEAYQKYNHQQNSFQEQKPYQNERHEQMSMLIR